MRRGPRAARVAIIVGTMIGLLLPTASAAAFELNGGCQLDLTSTDASGATVDTASGPSETGGTQADPFLVDWDGSVSWDGTSGDQVFNDHTWQTYVFLIPIPVRGGDPNSADNTVAEGSAGVSANAPFQFTGLYYVSGDINGAGGTHCDGNGWFKLTGNPITTIPFWVAVLIAVSGAALVGTARPHATAGPTDDTQAVERGAP